MAGVAAALGREAAPVTVEWSGGVVTIRPVDLGEVVSDLESWLAERESKLMNATLGPMVHSGLMTQDELATKLAKLTDDAVNRGEFALGSPKMTAVFQSVIEVTAERPEGSPSPRLHSGVLHLLRLLTGMDLGTVMTVLNEKGDEFLRKTATVLKRSLPGGPPPNAPGPAA